MLLVHVLFMCIPSRLWLLGMMWDSSVISTNASDFISVDLPVFFAPDVIPNTKEIYQMAISLVLLVSDTIL